MKQLVVTLSLTLSVFFAACAHDPADDSPQSKNGTATKAAHNVEVRVRRRIKLIEPIKVQNEAEDRARLSAKNYGEIFPPTPENRERTHRRTSRRSRSYTQRSSGRSRSQRSTRPPRRR